MIFKLAEVRGVDLEIDTGIETDRVESEGQIRDLRANLGQRTMVKRLRISKSKVRFRLQQIFEKIRYLFYL